MKRTADLVRLGATLAVLIATTPVLPAAAKSAPAQTQCGTASWYALYSRTASGQMMNPKALTAAHRSLPFGTKVLVTNQANGRQLWVTINDRGPFIGGRIIDLSRAAAERLGFRDDGITKVCLKIG